MFFKKKKISGFEEFFVLTCSISNFAEFIEGNSISPIESIHFLKLYNSRVSKIIENRHGIVVGWIGDATRAIWSANKDGFSQNLSDVLSVAFELLKVDKNLKMFDRTTEVPISVSVLVVKYGCSFTKQGNKYLSLLGFGVQKSNELAVLTNEIRSGVVVDNSLINYIDNYEGLSRRELRKDIFLVELTGETIL